ncbi:MAG: DUF2269 family protein [Actinomycetota bacterium]
MHLLASFSGNTSWFAIILTLHVFGAIVGLGPTFAFAIIGPAAGKQEHPAAGLALLEIMEKIERGMVIPILIVIQLGTGIALIFNRGLNHNFFTGHHGWLIAGILLYVLAMSIVFIIDLPAMGRAIRLAHEGKGGTPEFLAAVRIPQMLGPVLTIIGVAIIVLMVWKPGSGCGSLYRC